MRNLFKNIYRIIPFKQQILTLLKFFWSPPHSIYQHLYFKGTLKIKIDKTHAFKIIHYGHTIENDLFWKGIFGSWEKHAMKGWANLCKDSDVIFDIGANTGVYSLVAKSVNPGADVHAFEPFQPIHIKMTKNTAINGYNIKANCAAVSNYTGDGVIFTEDAEFAYSVTVNQNLWIKDKAAIKLDIKTITLKDYIDQNNITSVDLMKIDVETHEPEVMEGFGEYFNNFQPILLIEVLTEEVVKKLNQYFLPSKNYNIYHVDEENGIKKTEALFIHKYYNFFVVPNGEKEAIFQKIVLNNKPE